MTNATMTNSNTNNECPDQDTLTDFLSGKLVPPALETCESHIETCQACHETLRGLNPTDTLSSFVIKAMELAPSTPTDEQFELNLVQRLADPANCKNYAGPQLTSIEVMQDRAAEVLRHVAIDSEDATSLGVLDSFRLLELIGAGGTGVVFRAYDFSLDREVALKVLRPSLGDVARDRFVAEAKAAASIDHENVVTIYQVGEHERLAWIAMQWVPGETLESRLQREGTLEENEVRRLTGQIAKGLAEAHRRQLVHRDIKPANIWIGDTDQRVRILDFGLVRITDNAPALTATGMLAGTPNFMSPEQAKGQDLDARSDLFSLGCVMYQMLTGKLPFNASTILATLQSIQSQRPETPIQLRGDSCVDLSDLTMALLEKQPGNRIQFAESLVKCLELPRSQWPMHVGSYASSSMQETQAITRPATGRGGTRYWGWVTAGLFGLFGFGMWLFAPQIIRIATNQGELVIETEDENVQVEVRENGEVIRVLDASSGASFDVRSGNFEISAIGKDGKAEFQVKPNQLRMSRGDREVVRVTLAKAAVAPTVPFATDSNPKRLFDDKPFAHWLKIAQSKKERAVRVNAIVACGKLCESPEQFEQLAVVLEELAKAEPLAANSKTGQSQLVGDLNHNSTSNGMVSATPEIGVFRGKGLKEWLSVLKKNHDAATQVEALKACATLCSAAGLHQELSSLLNDYVDRHARFKKINSEQQRTLYLGFIETLEKLPAEGMVDFLALQLKQGSQNSIKWALAGLLSQRDLKNFWYASLKIHSPQVREELKKRAEELLGLCQRRSSIGAAEAFFLKLLIEGCHVFEDASSKTDEAVNRLLVRLPATNICVFLDLLPNDVVEQRHFDLIKNELFSKETSPETRDAILSLLQMLKRRKLKEKYIFVQKLVADTIANQLGPEPIKFDRYRRMIGFANSLDVEQATEFKRPGWVNSTGLHEVEISSPAVVVRKLLDEICYDLRRAVRYGDQELYQKNGLASAKTFYEILSKRLSVALEKLEGVTLKHYQLLQIEHDIDAIGKMGRGEGGKLSEHVFGATFGPKQK